MTERNILCVYHAECQDGFSAAWAVWKALGEKVEYYRGIHGEAPPDVTGMHVIIVDFSYKRPVIDRMLEQCASLLILDHHKSAKEDLADLPPAFHPFEGHMHGAKVLAHGSPLDKAGVVFNMEKSGAVLTWEYFHPDVPVPQFLLHVQDRDLWQFKLEYTKEISEYAFSQPYDFGIWDDLAFSCELPYHKVRMVEQGEAILRKHNKDVDELVPLTKRRATIGGYNVPIANLPYTMASDAAGLMAEGNPFAATYYDGRTHRHWSLRSRGNGIDVSEVAKKYGGGGHRAAAGFRTEIGWEGDPDWCSTGVV